MGAVSEKKTADVKPIKNSDERNAWAEDQEKHRYYYDDAHGYETYKPDEDEDGDDEEATSL